MAMVAERLGWRLTLFRKFAERRVSGAAGV
jgi:hypothetical protein